jgi:hypothetical protein
MNKSRRFSVLSILFILSNPLIGQALHCDLWLYGFMSGIDCSRQSAAPPAVISRSEARRNFGQSWKILGRIRYELVTGAQRGAYPRLSPD